MKTKDTIPKGKRVTFSLVEKLSRLICDLNGQDADFDINHRGANLSLGQSFPMWKMHSRLAEGIVTAGWKPPRKRKVDDGQS